MINMKAYLLTIITIFWFNLGTTLAQVKDPTPVGKLKPYKPKFAPNCDFIILNMYFNKKEDRLKYMETYMCSTCKNLYLYNNKIHYIREIKKSNEYVSIDDRFMVSDGKIVTIKMSDNCLFVFSLHDIIGYSKPDYKPTPTDSVYVGFLSYKYGEIDKNTVRFFRIKKKRILVSNNIFTEEINVTKEVKFILEEKYKLTKIILGTKEILLEDELSY